MTQRKTPSLLDIALWGMLILFGFITPLQSQDIVRLSDLDPIKISGSLGISTVFFRAEGRNTNRKPFTWLLNGDPVLTIYGTDIPISIMVSEQERDFRQPFNRLGISPSYKWAKAYLGYHNLTFSKFSLAGHAMVGAGAELNPGKWRLSYINGRLLKAVQPNQLVEDSDFFAIPSYKRTGQSLKIGYGTPTNFVDLIFLKATDREQSIDSIPLDYGLQPSSNAVISFITKQKLAEAITFELEYAQSNYTNDVRASSSERSEGLFKILSFLDTEKTSTDLSSALDASLEYRGKSWGTKLRFERVSPNYRSMGAYFFLNDIRKITIEPQLQILDRKVTINGSLGFQKNNLAEQKSLQTNRSIGSLRISAKISPKYFINANYANYGVSQKQGLVTLSEDNLISQVTQNWGVNQNFQKSSDIYMHNAMLSYQRQTLSDKNTNTSGFSNYQNNTLFFNYNLTYLPLNIGTNLTYTYSAFNITNLNTIYQGPTLSLQAGLLKNKLRASLSQSFLSNKSNNEKQRSIQKTTIRASYKLNKFQKLSFRFYSNKGQSFSSQTNPFQETKIDLEYVYRFN